MHEITDWHRNEVALNERYWDLRREADKARLVRETLAGRAPEQPLFCRMLHWLGHRLEAWGRWLQQRFAADRPRPSLPAAQQAQ